MVYPRMSNILDKRKIAVVFLLLIITSLGFYIRYDNISHWLTYKTRYFSPVDNTPLTLEVDSYYYLDIAQDILKGNLEKVDPQRQAPNSYRKFISRPLLSVMLALVSKLTGTPLERVAIYLPPYIGVLLTIPVYFFAVMLFRLSCRAPKANTLAPATIAGMIAVLFTIVSPLYVERSSIGWCDTDILNVTLLCSLACIALYAAVTEKKRELILLLAAFTVLTVFFIQWWDQATTPVVAFSLGYFVLAGTFSTLNKRSNGKLFVLFFVVLCLLIFGVLNVSVLTFPRSLLSVFQYSVSVDDAASHFRYAGQLVAEQQDTSIAIMAKKIAGNTWLFFLSLAGTFLLALISRKHVLFLLPWLALLVISTKSHRVLIFPGVLFGLGMGTLAFLACRALRQRKPVLFLPAAIAVFALVCFPVKESQSYFSRTPQSVPQLFDTFKLLAKQAPKDSVIWSSWGHGHPLVFYTDARTIGDGIFHPPELVYSQYVPYAASSPRLAANWIMFYATHGLEGLRKANELFAGSEGDWAQGMPALQELLAGGIEPGRFMLQQKYAVTRPETEEILSFLFPQSGFPVYFLLDYITYEEQWFRWGRDGLNVSNSPLSYTMVPIQYVYQEGNMMNGRSDLGTVSFDMVRGIGTVGEQKTIALKHIRIDGRTSLFVKNYNENFPHTTALSTLLIKQGKYLTNGILVDDAVLNTVFTQMLLLNKYDKSFFVPILDESPLITVYRVRGDVYNQQRVE